MRFTQTTRSSVLALLVFAFSTPAPGASDLVSLEILWSSRLDSPPSVPPVVDNERVYLSLRTGKVHALALADGRAVWTIDLPFATAMAISDGLVVGATTKALVAIDGASGLIRWNVPLPDVHVAPTARAGWVVVGSGPDLLAFRARDGSLVWRLPLGAALQSAVTIEGDRVYAPLSDGAVVAVEITGGTIAWKTQLPAPGGGITVGSDRLYLGAADKFFYALELKDGDRDWRWRTAAQVLAPAAVDERRVYYTALDNVVRAVDAGSGVQRWRYAMESRPLAGPVLDNDTLIIAGAADVRALRAADGTLAGKWGAPGELASAPILVGGVSGAARTRAVIVTGATTGDWRVYGVGAALEPAPQPLKEIPGRPLSPDVPPAPRAAPTPDVRHPR